MGNRFSKSSTEKLYTLHPDLTTILTIALEIMDFTIVCGHRDKAAQQRAYTIGNSKVQFPGSKHNTLPSLAVDIAPYSSQSKNIKWDETAHFVYLAGIIGAVAHELDIPIRWGGDWDGDQEQDDDENFRDLGHFELIMG